MSALTRRRAFQSGAVALAALGGGCTSLGRETPEPTRLNEISVWNYDPEPRTVYVLVLDDDPVYWSLEVADAYSENDDVLGGAEFDGLPAESGTYVLYAWRDDQPRSEWERLDLGEYGHTCTNLVIRIGSRSGDDRGEVSILASAGCPEEDAGS
ncbi:hypothetical protein [Natrarchaeobius chitinivorans]|uniref:Uncharacterized protein n=1 Tax=Natrarchaeobius chitinivorans TaxID=1679083 RepID=A0A3N6P8P5_NATCH|nr:hypothetical protein [Natrarchaeobius chitinivorans]RQG95069.1 hypothetical protein EA473_08905 [Natrarchaeobius chitinivorans]